MYIARSLCSICCLECHSYKNLSWCMMETIHSKLIIMIILSLQLSLDVNILFLNCQFVGVESKNVTTSKLFQRRNGNKDFSFFEEIIKNNEVICCCFFLYYNTCKYVKDGWVKLLISVLISGYFVEHNLNGFAGILQVCVCIFLASFLQGITEKKIVSLRSYPALLQITNKFIRVNIVV